MRWVALFAAGIASLGQLAAVAVIAPCLRLLQSRYLFLLGVPLLPFAIAAAFLAIPFWVLAMVSNSYLMVDSGVHGVIEESGIRLTSRRALTAEFVAFTEILSVQWVLTPPLGSHFLIDLKTGSQLQVDFLPREEFLQACRERGIATTPR